MTSNLNGAGVRPGEKARLSLGFRPAKSVVRTTFGGTAGCGPGPCLVEPLTQGHECLRFVGHKHFWIPVEVHVASRGVHRDREFRTLDPSRTEKVTGSLPRSAQARPPLGKPRPKKTEAVGVLTT